MFLLGVVGAPSLGEAASYGFDNFSVTSSIAEDFSYFSRFTLQYGAKRGKINYFNPYNMTQIFYKKNYIKNAKSNLIYCN